MWLETVLIKKLSWPQKPWVVEGCEIPENKTSLSTPLCGGGSPRQGASWSAASVPSWCLEQTACQSLLQVRWPASVLTRTDTIENCIRRRAFGICSKYITEHKWLANTACLAVCKGNDSMDFWIRREGLFFLCAGTSTWWLGRKLILENKMQPPLYVSYERLLWFSEWK